MCFEWQRPNHLVNDPNSNLSEIDPFCGAENISLHHFQKSPACIIIIEIPTGNNQWDDTLPERTLNIGHNSSNIGICVEIRFRHRWSQTNRVKSLDNRYNKKEKQSLNITFENSICYRSSLAHPPLFINFPASWNKERKINLKASLRAQLFRIIKIRHQKSRAVLAKLWWMSRHRYTWNFCCWSANGTFGISLPTSLG